MLKWWKRDQTMPTDKHYWQRFYASDRAFKDLPPSQFAVFTANEILNLETAIIEFGCGNGRDSKFFSNLGIKVLGIDASSNAISLCNAMCLENANFEVFDLNSSKPTEQMKKLGGTCKDGVTIYARFFLHAITEANEESLLKICKHLIKNKGQAYFEFRTEKDERLQKITPNHYRRYVNPISLLKSANQLGLQATYFVEGFGFAKHKEDDAFVARIVLRGQD